MDIQKLSSKYQVRRLVTSDTEPILKLSQSNPTFFRYCPPTITRPVIRHDMTVIPPQKTQDDKFYVGFFEGENLVAMLDLVLRYPDKDTAWIGQFMVDAAYQGAGIGSSILQDVIQVLHDEGLKLIGVAYGKGDMQSEQFLLKNDFIKTETEIQEPDYVAVVMERLI